MKTLDAKASTIKVHNLITNGYLKLFPITNSGFLGNPVMGQISYSYPAYFFLLKKCIKTLTKMSFQVYSHYNQGNLKY